MPAPDAPCERVSSDRWRRMESRIAFGIANSHHWAAGFCVGNFPEHALRRCSDVARLRRAGRRDFLCRVSPNAFGARGHGILSSLVLFDCTHSWAALVWKAQYG